MRYRSQTMEVIQETEKAALELIDSVILGMRAFRDRMAFFARMFFSEVGNVLAFSSGITTIFGTVYWLLVPNQSILSTFLVLASAAVLIASATKSIISFKEFLLIDDTTSYKAAVNSIREKKMDGCDVVTRNDGIDPIICYNIKGSLLDSARNIIEVKPNKFRIDTSIISKPNKIIGLKSLFTMTNDAKIRLASEIDSKLLEDYSRPIKIQETDYYSDRCTNNIATKALMFGDGVIKSGSSLMVDETGSLAPLDKTWLLSNQIGGSTILMTKDPYLVYVLQGRKTEENAWRLASSGSGSFDWKRMRETDKTSFAAFVKSEIERELREEVGVPKDRKLRTFLVGFARYLYRNGKPEFMALSLADVSFYELEVKYNERRFINKHLKSFSVADTTREGLVSALAEFEAALRKGATQSGKKLGTASSPLLANLHLANRFVKDDIESLSSDFVCTFFEENCSRPPRSQKQSFA